MSTVDPTAKIAPQRLANLTDEELLERDIKNTLRTVLEFGDVGYERAEAGAHVATGLLMQLLRERGFVAEKDA